MSQRAYNRQQSEKALKRARKVAKRWVPKDPATAEHIAHKLRDTPKLCSCHMCRNPRRSGWNKSDAKLTMQERRAKDKETT